MVNLPIKRCGGVPPGSKFRGHRSNAGGTMFRHQAAIPRGRVRLADVTRMGKLVFQVAGAFAEFERTMIRQRVKAGLKRAVAQDMKLGRPKIDSATERKVRKQLAKGVGILKVAKSLGIGTGTVQRTASELG